MKKVIKIINCSDDVYWYKDNINEQYEFAFIDTYNNFYVVDMCDGKGSFGSVNPIDCEVTEVDDDVFIREKILTQEEMEKERLNLLEQAMNDYILGGM